MSIRDDQRRHYANLWQRYGMDLRAVGWRQESALQDERFFRLSRAFDREQDSFTVHDIGAGLGDFGRFLRERFPRAEYSGSEVCDEFLEVCRRRFPRNRFMLRDVSAELPPERYDFVTQSGLFNGRLSTPVERWQQVVFDMLRAMYAMARKGIAANFLTTYCDPERMRAELHYQHPQPIIEFVSRQLSRHWELDAAGPLYEYTLRVYRPEYVRERYAASAFSRYFKRADRSGR